MKNLQKVFTEMLDHIDNNREAYNNNKDWTNSNIVKAWIQSNGNNLNTDVKKLIDQYQEKIKQKDKSIEIIRRMIRDARNGETSYDIEDLKEEKLNAQRDRQLYFQFIKDLQDLI